MADYTETFTSVNGDVVDATELEGEFDAIATAIATKVDSDGSGAMTGDLSLGSNNLTNVADPTAAQHAATKNYTDTMFVSDFGTVPLSGISTTEAVELTLQLAIPAAWNAWDIELLMTGRVDQTAGAPATDTTITIYWRDTGLGGTVRGTGGCVMGTDASDWTSSVAVFGFIENHSTGAGSTATYVLTSQAGANSGLFSVDNVYARALARRRS